ncbi:extracellular matrix regulator RemB [Shimazuella kribbensis]|uniref:extracellular matrix regulator RemB n=1 Tax=Shimazuella kribbensis TaxID=139808 RepID=UPI000490997A
MFIHLGGNQMIRLSDVVAIVDAVGAVKSSSSIHFPSFDGEVKSFIITTDHIYTSPISSNTLLKRSQSGLKVVSML